jgi:hypothetical protein
MGSIFNSTYNNGISYFMVYTPFLESSKYNYRILLHATFFLISCTSAILCNIVSVSQLNVYFLVYSAIILFFNIQVFWEPVHSIIQSLLALVLLAVFFNIVTIPAAPIVLLANGGQFFFIVSPLYHA